MTALLTCLAIPLFLAFATGSSAAWWAVLVMLPLVAAYTAVLYRARRVMAEKEINAAFLGAPDRTEASLEELFGPFDEAGFFGAELDGAQDWDEEPVSAAGGDW